MNSAQKNKIGLQSEPKTTKNKTGLQSEPKTGSVCNQNQKEDRFAIRTKNKTGLQKAEKQAQFEFCRDE